MPDFNCPYIINLQGGLCSSSLREKDASLGYERQPPCDSSNHVQCSYFWGEQRKERLADTAQRILDELQRRREQREETD